MKGLKILFAILVPLGIVGGVLFGLGKAGIGPLGKLLKKPKPGIAAAAPNGANAPKAAGATSETPGATGTPGAAGADDPLAGEKRVLAAQRKAFDEERAAWQSQVQAAQSAKQRDTQSSTLDPKALTRMASVYESMSADAVTRIFAKLPDSQVLALLSRMEEKRVGEILAAVAPERAARLTLSLSRPVASATPSS